MMIELLSGTNTTLFILSCGYLFFVLKYQYMTKHIEKSQQLSRYVWSVSIAAAAIWFSAVLFFLFDFGLIFKSNQRDLSIISRFLFVAHLMIAYSALDWKRARIIVPGALIIGVVVFMFKTLH